MMLEKVIGGLTEDQMKGFLESEKVADLFGEEGYDIPTDKVNFKQAQTEWEDDFKTTLANLFKDK